MINLDSVRSALFSPDPYTRMDQLVRAELDTGRTTAQIVDDMRPFIEAALDTPGLTEDGEEAFLSTLDALTGNCRLDQCYQDPPSTFRQPVGRPALPVDRTPPETPPWSLPK